MTRTRCTAVLALLVAASAVLGACGSGSTPKLASKGAGSTSSTSATGDDTTPSTVSGGGGGGGTASSAGVGPGSTVKPGGGSPSTSRPRPTATTVPPTTTTRPAPAGTTGVRGVVTAGPQCPVQRESDHSCDDKAVPAHLTLTRGDGSTAAAGDAGADGQFLIAAAPGDYTLSASSPNAMRCASQAVAVTAGHVTDVHVSCDTGIR
jgi:hypothetical protein